MAKPKLYRLLEQLDGKELPWFDKFIGSPYFNSNELTGKLWGILREAFPDFEKLGREQVFAALCPGQPFDAPFLNARYSELSQLVEEFFVQQELRREGALSYPARRAACRSRKMPRQHERECRRQAGELEAGGWDIRNAGPLLDIYDELYFGRMRSARQEEGNEALQKAMSCLDRHFLLFKLKYLADLWARQQMFNEAPAVLFQEAALAEAAGRQEQDPLIRLYCRLASLLRGGFSEESFRALWRLFREDGRRLPQAEKSFFIAKFVTLAFQRLNKGEMAYQSLLVEVYKYADEGQLLVEDGQITDSSFSNVCTVGIAAKEFDWVLGFMARHKKFLPPPDAEQAYALGKTAVLLGQEDYKGAHLLLQGIRDRRPNFQLRLHSLSVRCLLGMCLEDTTCYSALCHGAEAFSRYIRRQPGLAAGRRKGYLNFVKAAKKIAALRLHGWASARARNGLRQWVGSLDPLMLRPWLEQLL